MPFPTKVLVLSAMLIAAVAQPAVARDDDERHRTRVSVHRIGRPTWKLVDTNVFSAPIGTAATGYAEFGETSLSLLPPPFHESHPQLLIGPGAPHPPPYRRELSEGLEQTGYDDRGPFTPDQFSDGKGVFSVWMVVPRGEHVTGSSPDFDDGPIVPNSLFPIHVEGSTSRNGEVCNSALASFDVPALNDPDLDPAFDVDGASHFPVFIADNADFCPADDDLSGRYEYELTMEDAAGNGWSISVRFKIRDQP